MNYTTTYLSAIDQIEERVWDSIAVNATPFMRHGFLKALEESGCVRPETGWQPHHMLITRDDALVAVLPLYIKYHSWGEYVFDQEWAHAYQQYGVRYYPKLLSAIPFTPVTGPRLVSSELRLSESLLSFVTEQIRTLCDIRGFSSWHCLFTPAYQATGWQNLNLLRRRGVQFHWQNNGYDTFDQYLSILSSKKRKTIKRERRRVREQGVEHVWVGAKEMSETDWSHFYRCYSSTYIKRRQSPYLNLVFFKMIAKSIPEHLLCLMAKQEGEPIASSLFFVSDSTLYGRYWGCLEDKDSLHFETCYYQGLEYAINHGLQYFDAGAQGEHKISRGFVPIETFSWHWINAPEFRDPIEGFVVQESEMMKRYQAECETLSPFRQE